MTFYSKYETAKLEQKIVHSLTLIEAGNDGSSFPNLEIIIIRIMGSRFL